MRVLRLLARSPALGSAFFSLGVVVLALVLAAVGMAAVVARRVERAYAPAQQVAEIRRAAYAASAEERAVLAGGAAPGRARDEAEAVGRGIAELSRLRELEASSDRVARLARTWDDRTAIARRLLEPGTPPEERARLAAALTATDEAVNAAVHRLLGDAIDAARAAAVTLQLACAGIGLAAVAVLSASTVFARRAVLRPLRRLVAAEAAVARGRLDLRVDTAGLAEVRELAFGFNEMVSALRARADEVRQKQQLLSRRERALQSRNRELAAANAELDAFAYAASHDLRAPLRGIESMARFLWEDVGEQLDPESRDKLDRIRRAARRLHELIDSLLEVARAGRELGRVEPVPLGECVEEALEALAGQVRDAGAEVHVTGTFATVQGDRMRLTQVFQNLIGNAIKYSSGAGRTPRIEIGARLEDEGGVVAAWVRDNGIGIPEDQHVRIFQLFRRLHRAGEYEGTGVGLSIVQRSVHAHGGDVSVESAPGRGSCFTVRLPLRSAAGLKEAA